MKKVFTPLFLGIVACILYFPFSQYVHADLSTSLVSYWNFDSDNSTDSVGGNDGTDNSMSYSSGQIGDGADFDGGSSYISIPTSGFPSGNSARTINLWVYFNTKPANDTSRSWVIYGTPTATHEIQFEAQQISGEQNLDVDANSLDYFENWSYSTNTWYMVSYTFDGSIARLYVDGSQMGSGSGSQTLATILSLGRIGGNISGGSYWDGSMDEIGVWDRQLSGSELTELYNSGAGLAYPFSGGGGGPPSTGATTTIPSLTTDGSSSISSSLGINWSDIQNFTDDNVKIITGGGIGLLSANTHWVIAGTVIITAIMFIWSAFRFFIF